MAAAVSLDKYICFGLTEPGNGSDASDLQTYATKTEGGYILNGNKRWIGGATFADYLIIWAKNRDDGNRIQGFIVEKGMKGLKTEKMEGKMALRAI